jgi:asparagine synthase (glutamine-hydrolysing)
MCGIAGIWKWRNSDNDKPLSNVDHVIKKLALRGPDAQQKLQIDNILLAHARLSIIDVSENANQPFVNDTKDYALVFNGEIFNYKILKEKYLSDKLFLTDSDTEVLLYLLITYGTECLSWLSGFYAFAFYDKRREKLTIARDRFGKKPLLYYYDNEYFAFASEMKAITSFGFPKTICKETLYQYFELNYVPTNSSIFKEYHKLKPGHFIEIQHNEIKEIQYYDIDIVASNTKTLDYNNAQKTLDNLMHQSVKERLISDVPLGAFLSGGIDSSVVVAIASKYVDKLKTFSIGFSDNPFFDETSYAQLVANKYNTEHTVFNITNNDILAKLYNVLDYIDEPFADTSALPQYILSKLTRTSVTVALSGDGGDEVFAGYNKHRAQWMAQQKTLLNTIIRKTHNLAEAFPQSRSSKIGNTFRQINRYGQGLKLSAAERYWRWCSISKHEDLNQLFTHNVLQHISQEKLLQNRNDYTKYINSNNFNELLKADMKLVLPGDMLYKVDMMSMANSLEVRSPFLDYRIVDFAFTLPTHYKIDKKFKKKIVQDSFRKYLPEQLYNRPKKGFDIPLHQWFKNELNQFIFDNLLSKEYIEQQNLFNYKYILQLKQRLHNNKDGDVVEKLWALIVFQYWHKKNCL